MKLISTHDVYLKSHDSITVLEETGQVVMSGQRNDDSGVILLFTPEGGKLREKEIKCPCKHRYISVLGISVRGTQYLGVLCPFCNDIKLLNLKTYQVTSAFSCENLTKFCHGEHNRLYVTTRRVTTGEISSIMKLDCSEIPFKPLPFLYKMKYDDCNKLCFVPSPYNKMITGNKYQTEAISCEKNEIIWKLDLFLKNDQKVINHQGAVFSARHSTVLVCDCSSKSRLLVLDPRNGSHLQTIDLPEMGHIYNLCPTDDKFILLHDGYITKHLSFFSIN